MRHLNCLVLLCLCLTMSGSLAAAQAQEDVATGTDAASLMLQAKLSPIKTLTAKFSQQTLAANDQLMQSSEGRMWLSPGGKFKINTVNPFEQTLVSDGDNLWTIDIDLDQAVVRPLEKDLKQVPILMFNAGDEAITAQYQVNWHETDGLEHFVLLPISIDALFEVLTLSFDDDRPVQIVLRDSLGQRSVIKFTSLVLNPELEADVFTPNLPEGIDLIDDREVDDREIDDR